MSQSTLDRLVKVLLVGAPLLFSSWVGLTHRSRVGTSDDSILMTMLDGRMYGFRTSELIYVGKPLSELLVRLYEASPTLPWWAMMEFGTQAVALSLAALVLLWGLRGMQLQLVSLALLVIQMCAAILFFQLQFTQVAILGSGIGSLLIIWSPHFILRMSGGVLVVVGISWRPEAGFLGLGIALLSSIPFLVLVDSRFNRNVLYAGVAGIAGTVVFLIQARTFLSIWSTSSAMSDYLTFNKARNVLDGLGNFIFTPESREAALQAGLTDNDWNLLRNWYFSDPDVFTTERLQAIAGAREAIPPLNSLPRLFGEYVNFGLVPIFSLFVALVLATLLALPVAMGGRRMQLRLGIGWLAGLFALYGVYAFGRLPLRISMPAMLIIAFSVLFGIRAHRKSQGDLLSLTRIQVVAAVVALAVGGFVFTSELLVSKSRKSQESQLIGGSCLNDVRGPALVFTSYSTPTLAGIDPFANPEQGDRSVSKGVLLGWQARSPDHTRHAKSLGFSPALLDQIASGQAAIVTADPNDLTLIANFLREHRGVSVVWETAGPCNSLVPGEPMVKRAVLTQEQR